MAMKEPLRRPSAVKKKIALIFWPKVGNQHLHLIGIRQYAAGFSHWLWKGFSPVNSCIPLLRAWKPDGIIGMLETPELARACHRLGVPAVDLGDRLEHQPCTQICVDHRQIGQMGALYFLERHFQHFAFCGAAGTHFAIERHRGFVETLHKAGLDCQTTWFKVGAGVPETAVAWSQPDPVAARWLAKLPRPLALMVSNDQLALMILSTCSEANIRVPEEVAVLGVDDDELMCTMANPPLSSIGFPAKKIGYEAAATLAAMMAGEAVSAEPLVFPPLPIVVRGSTERLMASDPEVSKALELIRANVGQRFSIMALTDALAVSRRSLERKFQRELSIGIQDAIRRSRVELARTLLRDTDMTPRAIAAKCGFANLTRLGVVFHRYTGTSPAAYRRQFQFRQ